MPERKRLPDFPDYVDVVRDESKLVVQKSNPLQTLSETEMTLAEFKILDAYLSKIDSHDEEKRYVRFEKGELERVLGVERIRKEELSKRLDNLFQVVTIKDKNKKNGFTKIALFEKAEVSQDENDLWQVDLACTASAMEYVFNIDNLGYLRYRLKNVVNLTSRYSYILYLYLEQNRYRRAWKIDLVELRKMLRCVAPRYEQFKFFNSDVLKKCQRELLEKTTIHFSYEPIRKGRKVLEIKFIIENVRENLLSDGFSEFQQEHEQENESELAILLGVTACKNEFSSEQIRVLQDLVQQAVSTFDEIEMCDYLMAKVNLMNMYNPKKEKRFSYLCSMIKKDIASE